MDYLLSLVGKDQETITNAIKDLAENAEKVKLQELEITYLHDKVDEHKEEVHYLKNKLNMKRDIIDDLEHEMEKKDIQIDSINEDLRVKDKELNEFEKHLSKQIQEINILNDNNQSMVTQISENVLMEKKLEIQSKVIKGLQERIAIEEKKTGTKEDANLKLLSEEIKELINKNDEKEKLLETLTLEKEELDAKFSKLEAEKMVTPVEEFDLERLDYFKCEECGDVFANKADLRVHKQHIHEMSRWRSKLVEVNTELSTKKFNLMSDLFKLKQQEIAPHASCNCKGSCKIRHKICNWRKSQSDELKTKMEIVDIESDPDETRIKVTKCDSCGQMFSNPNHFIHHMETNHKAADVTFLQG